MTTTRPRRGSTQPWRRGSAPRARTDSSAFVEHLSTPGRVVIEIVPDGRIGFDAEEMFRDSPAGPSRTEV